MGIDEARKGMFLIAKWSDSTITQYLSSFAFPCLPLFSSFVSSAQRVASESEWAIEDGTEGKEKEGDGRNVFVWRDRWTRARCAALTQFIISPLYNSVFFFFHGTKAWTRARRKINMLTLLPPAVLPIKVIVTANDAANLNFRVCAIDVRVTSVTLFMNYGYN